jgi:hypothetical protein
MNPVAADVRRLNPNPKPETRNPNLFGASLRRLLRFKSAMRVDRLASSLPGEQRQGEGKVGAQ